MVNTFHDKIATSQPSYISTDLNKICTKQFVNNRTKFYQTFENWRSYCQIIRTENQNFQNCITYVLLPVHTLPHNDVIVNKNCHTFNSVQNFNSTTETHESFW